jgi:filamentous hemagglutinin family protein
MNHIYRSIWSEALATWIAVPENTQSKGKRSSVRNVALATSLLCCSATSFALPTGEQVVAGQVAVSTPSAGQMQINQSSQQAIMQWQGFSIAPNEIVNIYQPNASATLLNRVIGQDASLIQGQLHANGQVFLINANGVMFGKTAQVDVGGLFASTHDINNADFLNANYHFMQGNSFASVDNQGFIRTADGGVVALIGSQVSNAGTIATPKGTTVLAAGKTVDLDFKGDGLVEVKVSEAALNALATNKGVIQADGGRVILTAKAAGQLVGTVLNSEGVVQARSLASRNGEIILDGGDSGVTQVAGTLDVSGNQAGEKGGAIVVTGDKVLLENTAKLNATGMSGGGSILVGGSWQGSNSVIHQATATIVKSGAVLDASATDKGNGGTVVTWSNVQDANSVTRAYGAFLAAGGVNGGDGGRIETSGHWLDVQGSLINAAATAGKNGQWLLDPNNITIQDLGTDTNIGGNPNWTSNSDSAILTVASIQSALNNGTSVIVSTGATSTSAEAGDITVNSAISKTAGTDARLSLNAHHNININANIGSTFNKLALQFRAKNAIIMGAGAHLDSGGEAVILNADADSSGAGNIQLYDGAVINSNGGNIVLGGGSCDATGCTDVAYGYGLGLGEKEGIYLFSNKGSWNTQLNSNGGNIVLSGKGFNGVSENYGVYSHWVQMDTRDSAGHGSGSITIKGTGGGALATSNTVNSSMGIYIDSNNIYTHDGDISITGTGGQGAVGSDNYGVSIIGSGSVLTAFGGGNIGITGVGGTGTQANHGIRLWENINYFTTTSGNILLNGTAGTASLGGDNFALSMEMASFSSGNNFTVNANGGIINANGASVSVKGSFILGSGIWNQISNLLPTFFAKDFDISGGTFIRALGGDGSVNPYQLADIYGLQGISNSRMFSKSYVLSNNIDATSTSSWHNGAGFVPIANNSTTPFLGNFDGANHTITGLNINLPSTDLVGLFGYVGNSGSVSNVGLLGGNIIGQKAVGELAGYNTGNISNAYATGSVSGVERVGGLVGQNDNTVTNAYATGNVTGAVIATAGSASLGGLVGFNNSGVISNVYATGNVSGNSQTGGLVGANFGLGSKINNAYATGNVNGNTSAGGLVGRNFIGAISNTYATGAVAGTSNVGGLVGWVQSGAVTNSFWDTETSGQTVGVGNGSSLGTTALTTAQMFSAASFTGFNFSTTAGAFGNNWVIVDNDGSLNNAGNATGATRPMLASEYATLISSSHQLQLMAMDLTADYSLINNLDLSSQFSAVNSLWTNQGFVPIGNSTTNFTGTFDGLNHIITGLNINRSTTDNVGLFGLAGDNVEIKNIGLIGGSITGQSQVGALLGAAGWNTVISNSYATSNVSGVNFVGGLVGTSRNSIENSYSTGNITASGYYIGGLVGDNFGKISNNSYATGNVSGSSQIGGLVGYNYYGATIENAHATGKVTGTSEVGG